VGPTVGDEEHWKAATGSYELFADAVPAAVLLLLLLQTLKSTQAMADAMRGATRVSPAPPTLPWRPRRRVATSFLYSVVLVLPQLPPHTHHYLCCPLQAMRVMNKRMNLPNMQKILMEFEKQNERMEMTSDMMGDAIDDAMEVRAAPVAGAARAAGWGSFAARGTAGSSTNTAGSSTAAATAAAAGLDECPCAAAKFLSPDHVIIPSTWCLVCCCTASEEVHPC
jgi:hypothetical protein